MSNALKNTEKIDRVNILMEALNLRMTEFAKTIGISYTQFYNYVRKKPDGEHVIPIKDVVIMKICTTHKIDIDYFQTDTINAQDLVINGVSIKDLGKTDLPENGYQMKMIATEVAANFSTPITEQYGVFEKYFVSKSIFDKYGKTGFLVKVKGKSMQPNIPDGAILVVTKIDNWKDIEQQIVAVAYDGIFTVKKIKKNESETGFITFHALNPDFSDKKVNTNEIHEVFKVERMIDAEIE